ncbi:hypothetical protein [Mesorhizobium sp. LjNodule214]
MWSVKDLQDAEADLVMTMTRDGVSVREHRDGNRTEQIEGQPHSNTVESN